MLSKLFGSAAFFDRVGDVPHESTLTNDASDTNGVRPKRGSYFVKLTRPDASNKVQVHELAQAEGFISGEPVIWGRVVDSFSEGRSSIGKYARYTFGSMSQTVQILPQARRTGLLEYKRNQGLDSDLMGEQFTAVYGSGATDPFSTPKKSAPPPAGSPKTGKAPTPAGKLSPRDLTRSLGELATGMRGIQNALHLERLAGMVEAGIGRTRDIPLADVATLKKRYIAHPKLQKAVADGILTPQKVLQMSQEQLARANREIKEAEDDTEEERVEAYSRTKAEAQGRAMVGNKHVRYSALARATRSEVPHISDLPPRVQLYQRPRYQ